MARSAERYVCQACGAVHRQWAGRCEACDEWNSIVEEAATIAGPGALSRGKARRLALVPLAGESHPEPRMSTAIAEFDRVAGGGLVAGSALLVAGDPGIGKSTLLLQVMAGLARAGISGVYISGEESTEQIRMRARRLGIEEAPLRLAAATSVRDILASLDAPDAPRAVVVDSIQTMFVDTLDSSPGTVAQVRASAQELIRLAKRRGQAMMLVGHITKEGQIAGPKVLEHMVDTVLYFEGERGHQFRILRAVKNRFGPSDEIGVFEMSDAGLVEVPNPSGLFLSERERDVNGAAVFAGIEGTRPLLVEIEALVAPSPLATPRRAVVGWDAGRLAMVMAVLEARCGLALAGNDIYLNVAGGLRIVEPAADLAVAAALVSSFNGVPVPSASVVFGEIALSGEVRAVSQAALRLKEAAKLGFSQALAPAAAKASAPGITLAEITRLGDLVDLLAAG